MKFPTIRDKDVSYGVNFILLFSLLLLSFFAQAKEVPKPTKRLVNDYAHVLTTIEVERLEQKLVAYDDTTSTQIAIVIEKSTDGEDIFGYAIRLAEKWGIGQKGKNNGVLIYIATEDHKLRILTGYGAEPTVTDAMARRIIEQILIPAIKKNQYFNGLDQSTTKISQLAAGEFEAEEEGDISDLWIFLIVILLFFLFAYLASKGKGGKGGGYYRGGHYDDPWRGSGGGWWIGGGSSGGGGGGFSGGGGFGGFGGGSFGGGGAGGSW